MEGMLADWNFARWFGCSVPIAQGHPSRCEGGTFIAKSLGRSRLNLSPQHSPHAASERRTESLPNVSRVNLKPLWRAQ